MAQYMILIYGEETDYSNADPEAWQESIRLHNQFSEQVVQQGGRILSGEALEPSSTATTIRGDVVTDGPFLESKEVLGGYYLVEAADLDQAIAFGKLCPAWGGGVEVRPIMDTSGG